MPFEALRHLYSHTRNTLVWLAVYFLIQAAIWVALALLIWFYPPSLFIIMVIFMSILSLVSVYFAFLFISYIVKLRHLKQLLEGRD